MANDLDVRQLLIERRKRTVGAIMQYAERELYPGMSTRQQSEFRAKVLEAIGGYHDLMIDLSRSLTGDAVVNEEALSILRRLDQRARV